MYPSPAEYSHTRPGRVPPAAPSAGIMDMRFSHYAPDFSSNLVRGYPGFPVSSHVPQGQGSMQPTQSPLMVQHPSLQSPRFQMQPPQPAQSGFLQPLSQFQMHLIQPPHHTHFIPSEILPPPPVGPPPSPPPPPPVSEEKMLSESGISVPPKVPDDPETVTNIEVLAAFVVKNGIQFELMARAKRAGDPKFAFLFPSDPGTEAAIGREYYEWKKWSLELEMTQKADNAPNQGSDFNKTFECEEKANNISGTAGVTVVLSRSPTLDVEMEDRKFKQGLVMEDLSPECSPRATMNAFEVPKDGCISRLKSKTSHLTFQEHTKQSKEPYHDRLLKRDDPAVSSDEEQAARDARQFGDDGLSRISDAYGDGDYPSFATINIEKELSSNIPVDDYQDTKGVILKALNKKDGGESDQIVSEQHRRTSTRSCSPRNHNLRGENVDFSPAHSRSHRWNSCSKPPIGDSSRYVGNRDLMDRMSSPVLATEEGQLKELEVVLNVIPDKRKDNLSVLENASHPLMMDNNTDKTTSEKEKPSETVHRATNPGISSDFSGIGNAASADMKESSIQEYSFIDAAVDFSSKAHLPSVTYPQSSISGAQYVPSGSHQSVANGEPVFPQDPISFVQEILPTGKRPFSGNLSQQSLFVHPLLPHNYLSQFQPNFEPASVLNATSKQSISIGTTTGRKPHVSVGPSQTPAFMSSLEPGANPVYHSSIPSEPGCPKIAAEAQQPVFIAKNELHSFSGTPSKLRTPVVSISTPLQHGFNAMSVLTFKPSLRHPLIGDTSKQFTFPKFVKTDAQSGMLTGTATCVSTSIVQNSTIGMPSTAFDIAMQSSGSLEPSTLTYPSSGVVSAFLPIQSKPSASPGKPYDPLADSIEPEVSFMWRRSHMENHDILSGALKANQSGDANYTGRISNFAGPVLGNASEKIELLSLKLPDTMLQSQHSMAASDDNMVKEVESLSPPDGKGRKLKVKKSEDRGIKLLRAAIAEYVKEVLKPTWREGHMSKEEFKTIVRKAVDKVIGTLQSHQIPKSQEKVDVYMASSRAKISKLVQSYIDKHSKP